jgi:hypothetical protein
MEDLGDVDRTDVFDHTTFGNLFSIDREIREKDDESLQTNLHIFITIFTDFSNN